MKELFELVVDIAKNGIPLNDIVELFSVCIIASLCSSLLKGTACEKEALDVSGVFVAVFIFKLIFGVIASVIEKTSELSAYSVGLASAMSSFLVFSGNGLSAGLISYGLSIFIFIINIVIKNILPVISALMLAVSFSSSLGNTNINSVKKISSFFIIFLTAVMSVISLFISFQLASAKSAENIAVKSAKLASAYTIPVVGKMISEAADTVAGGFSVIKSTFGISALLIVLVLILPQIVSVLVYKFVICIIHLLSDFLGSSASAALDCADALLSVLLAASVFTSLVFIYSIYVFLSVEAAI